jgi:glutamate N-acetyltransferase/amino-acid N-acetyltransferase
LKHLSGGFSNVVGFSSAGTHIGIKSTDKDFAVLFSDTVCTTAAVYTSNQIQGAPLLLTKQHLANNNAQAIVVNSGIANVATGEQGVKNAAQTAELLAAELNIKVDDVIVASTGVIGPQLPMEKIAAGITGIKAQLGTNEDFAEAIWTTDTRKKEICVSAHGFTIAGCAKGSGMISPNMATMLSFIATDAAIAEQELSEVLQACVGTSFNMMSVDMDTSTSDMVVVMANGRVPAETQQFREVLEYVCQELAKMVARDGEGATKLIVSEARGAYSQADARKVARSIVTSNLVKTAIYGNDPNWGRLIMALGNSGAEKIDQAAIQIWINQNLIVDAGAAAPDYDSEKLSAILAANEVVTITIDLHQGTENATAYGCDMSEEYVKINAEYTT